MSLDYPRALGPSVRHALGDDVLVEFAAAEAITSETGIALLRPERPGRNLVLLHQRPPATTALIGEAERLLWLAGRGAAPEMVASARADEGDEAVLVRLSVDAVSAENGHPMGPEALVNALAEALRAVHELPVDQCPLAADVAMLRNEVDRKIEHNQTEVADAGPYIGRSAVVVAELFDAAMQALPATDDPAVFVHGSIRPSRLWLDPRGEVTLLGWGRGGVGDRHLDLAAAAMMLSELHGPALVGPFFEAYGFDLIDLRRLDAFQMLAHLLR